MRIFNHWKNPHERMLNRFKTIHEHKEEKVHSDIPGHWNSSE
jgi:hypothetical protein